MTVWVFFKEVQESTMPVMIQPPTYYALITCCLVFL